MCRKLLQVLGIIYPGDYMDVWKFPWKSIAIGQKKQRKTGKKSRELNIDHMKVEGWVKVENTINLLLKTRDSTGN